MTVSTAEAYADQAAALIDWLDALPVEAFERPSVLEGWDVRTLTGHLLLIHRGLLDRLASPAPGPAIPLADYVRSYRSAAPHIAASTLAVTGQLAPSELVEGLRAVPDARPTLAALGPGAIILGGRGPATAADWLTGRLIELVVHADDLSRSLPDLAPAPIERAALATVTRALAEILAVQAPGRSVELRVPPFAAVQAVAGPRHTRGTPPNVVETDPLTWVRLACGRLRWDEAVASGSVRASGVRAELADQLPLLG